MKRRPALIPLSREHHTALKLAKRIADTTAIGAQDELMKALPTLFAAELEPHFQSEEADLLPRLEAAGEHELVARTLAEHHAMRALCARLAEGDRASLSALGTALHDHVRFEERELFVSAEKVLPACYLDESS